MGLNKCSSSIDEVSLNKAKDKGKTECGICFE